MWRIHPAEPLSYDWQIVNFIFSVPLYMVIENKDD